MELAVPGDAGDGLIGEALRIGHAVAQRAHAQHTATGRGDVFALDPGAGMALFKHASARAVSRVDACR